MAKEWWEAAPLAQEKPAEWWKDAPLAEAPAQQAQNEWWKTAPVVKPEEEGFFTGVGKSIYGGARDTGGSLYSAGATAVGANQAVVESAQAAAARSPEQAKALQAYQADIEKRKQAGDEGLLAGIKNVAGATVDNPEGALQMVLSQLPNTAVALGAGAAGAGTGAAIGSVVPGVGTAIGGTVGFLVGLFGANTALELGSKAQEKARDGEFTDAERYEAMKEGVVKGATITAVDAATFGASKWVMGTANRAVETATVRTIENANIDAAKAVTSIKEAQAKALEAAAGQSKEATTAAVEKATVEAMAREGLTDPALVASIRQAQAKALEGVNTVARKAGRGGAALGLESTGEGLGEYLGEYAATGEASPTDAVLEALAGLSLSLTELHGATRLDKPGALTGGTNAIYSQYSRALDDQLKAEEVKVTEQLTAQLGRPPTEEELNAKLDQLYGTPAGSPDVSGGTGASVPTPIGGAASTDTSGIRTPDGEELATDTEVAGGAGVGAQSQPSTLDPKQQRIEEITQEFIDAGLNPQNARQNAEEQVNNETQADAVYEEDRQQAEQDAKVVEARQIAKVNFEAALDQRNDPTYGGDVDAALDSYRQNTADTLGEQGKNDYILYADREFDRLVEEYKAKQEAPTIKPAIRVTQYKDGTYGLDWLDRGGRPALERTFSTEEAARAAAESNFPGEVLQKEVYSWETKQEAPATTVKKFDQLSPAEIAEQNNLKAEVAKISDELETLGGDLNFIRGMRLNARRESKVVLDEKGMDFYRSKLEEQRQLKGKAPEKFSEERGIGTYLRDKPKSIDRYKKYVTGSSISSALAKVNAALQKLTDSLNNRGFKVDAINNATPDASAKEAKKLLSQLAGSAERLLTKHEAVDKKYKSADPDAVKAAERQVNNDIKAINSFLESEEMGGAAFAREEPLPYLAGMHPETATAVQENDITGALKALARNTSGFFSDLAKRLAELKLQTGISFDNERNLVRRAIDLKTAAQQKRLFTYISIWHPNYYDKYFKNYDREENLEKVFEGLKAVEKLNLGPVIDEYNEVVEQYEKNIPGLTAPGAYFPQFNEITLNTKTRTGTGNRVMLHEVVHAATVAMLAKDSNKLTPEQQQALQALWDMYRYAQNVLPPGHYGMTNIYEFVSEVFTNKKFQDQLRVIPYKVKGQKGGLLTAFIQKVLDLFGMNNLASSAMVQAEKLFSAEVPSTTVPSGPKFATGKRNPKPKGPISTPDTARTAESVARTYIDVINDAIKGRVTWDEARKEMSSTLWSAEGGNVRKAMLGFLNLRQLADLTATKFPQLTGAIKVIEQMLSYRGAKLKRAENTTSKWIAAQRRDPQMSALMSRVMLEATMRGIDPDTAKAGTLNKPLEDAWNALDKDFKEVYREVREFYADSVKDMVDTLKERAKAHGTPTEIAQRLKDIDAQFGPDKLVKPYFPLRRFGDHWFQIGTGNFKEFYTFESRSTRDLTMKKRIKELSAGNKQQQSLAETVHSGSGTSDLFSSMSTTKVIQDAQKLIDNIGSGLNLATETGASAAAKLKDEMKDTLNQLLYITLPQTSMRKMFINRKSVQGASEDMLRVFATTAVHSAYQQSRLKYAEAFLGNLVNAREYIKNFPPAKQSIYDDYIKEVEARTTTILSTEDTSTAAKVAGKLSEATFYFMLSAPFTAMLNIIGATTIAMPYIGARYGYAKANALMLKNLGKYTATAPSRTFAPMAAGKFLEVQFPSIVEGGKLTPILQRAADLFVADGDITISLTNDINNLAERPSGLYTGNYENVKKVLSGLFHQSERLNREVVLMTTFELAYEKFKNADKTDLQGVIERDKTTGQPIKYTEAEAFEAAIAESREIAGQTLGDFSRQMKPRYFTSPLMSVLTKFKQYAVLATYVVMRNLYLSLGAPFSKSELKELRTQLEKDLKADPDKDTIIKQRMGEIETQRKELYKEARRRMAGILGVTFLYGGAEAMPFFSMLGPIVAMFASGEDDDEDPTLFEWHSWFRNYMQETFGGATGAILARGAGTAISGGALSERVSLDLKDLWYRDGRYSPDVRQSVLETAIANSGPVVGLGMNFIDAYGLAKEGQLDRAFEKLLPAIASKPLVGARIAAEEGRTRRGVELAGDFSAWEVAIQAVGLQPERFAIAQKNAIDAKLHEQKVLNEKNSLLNRLWMERDTDEYDVVLDKIGDFNDRHPVLAITGETIQDSFKNRAKNQAIAENLGVQLSNPKMIAEVESKLQYKPYSVFGKNE